MLATTATGRPRSLRWGRARPHYEETRGVLESVIRDAVTYTEHAKRKTVTAMDVVYDLKRQDTLYGFCGCLVRAKYIELSLCESLGNILFLPTTQFPYWAAEVCPAAWLGGGWLLGALDGT